MQYNLYQILGVDVNATQQEIKTAYRSLAKLYHPDVSKDSNAETKFIIITEAYEILYDPSKRSRYDYTNQSPSSKSATGASQKQHEKSTREDRENARRKAKHYKNMNYKRFDSEYFSSSSSYFFPKFFGCLGFGFIGLVVLGGAFILIVMFELPLVIFSIPAIICFFGAAYAGANYSAKHNEREKIRFRKRNAKK